MPLLYIHKSSINKRKVLLWFHDGGKAKLENWPEIEKYLDANFDIVSIDFRGLGETRMPFKAVSTDDPAMVQLNFDRAYIYPLSGVLADFVYNSLLTGRPYFLQMIEDAEIASRFAQVKLGRQIEAVAARENDYLLAKSISETLPGITLLPQAGGHVLTWSEIVNRKQEIWPIQYLLPSGAYIH